MSGFLDEPVFIGIFGESGKIMNDISKLIRDIERGAINENSIRQHDGVIVVDSIEDFMAQNNAVPLEDLDKALGINGAR